MEYRDALSWRVFRDDAGDHFMFFDASTECPATRELAEAEKIAHLDSVVSVSAVERERDQLELLDDKQEVLEDSLEDLPF